ncbi:MAG: hypothetical protein JSV91_02070 [Phycisphaerales bacterium]|nr:MAG: hypothetical protein JSV91_02070 [Phycisphaerales bacterium]
MNAENRCNAVCSDPGDRVIRLHAASLAKAAEARRAANDVAAAGSCRWMDAGQCRILLNEARREIDRLRRGEDRADLSLTAWRIRELEAELAARRQDDDENMAPDPSASPPKQRMAYANDPIGKIPPPEAKVPSPPAPTIEIASYFHVTNLGTLLDALA